MDNTIIQQGSFVSTGANVPVILRSDVDWMKVVNWTQSITNNINTGVEFFWQRGMPVADGMCYYHVAATQALSSQNCITLGGSGFQLFDTSGNPYGPNVAITRIPANGVVVTGSTAGLYVGSLVRFNNVLGGLQHCNSMIYAVTNVGGPNAFTIVPAANNVDTGVTIGNYQIVNWSSLFYPRNRNITAITQAANAVVTTPLPHGLIVGQKIRFVIPSVTNVAYGMTQLNNITATILTVPTPTTFTVDVDTTGFTAFAFPLTANTPFTYAQVIPEGENTAAALNAGTDILSDATQNTGVIGIGLYAGAYGPAGQQGDLIYWVAGKSFNV